MKKNILTYLFLTSFAWISAQNDSIDLEVKLLADRKTLEVKQDLTYFNKGNEVKSEIKLLNWIASYRSEGTNLYGRKIEDRDRNLHFAKPEELGYLLDLTAISENQMIEIPADFNKENLFFKLQNPLYPGEKITLQLQYTLQLPSSSFTGYGTDDKNISLKYFFLVPDSFEEIAPVEKTYNDTEETSNYGTFWKINLDIPAKYYAKSNLKEIQVNYFQGLLKGNPEILISQNKYPTILTSVGNQKVMVDFGYHLSAEEQQYLEFYLPLQLKYINDKTGIIPKKLFISEKFKKKEDFLGNDDIEFWKFRFRLFKPAENVDFDYFSIISKSVIEQHFSTYKNEDHWFTNGLKTYLEIQYIKTFYPDYNLLGQLPEAKILGMRPLKIFNAARLKLIERYGIAYQYMMTQNLDQKIAEPFYKLSNFNEMAISNFETGSLFNFVAEKMGTAQFDAFLRNYISIVDEKRIDTKDFLDQMAVQSKYSSSFFEDLMQRKHRVNFDLKKFDRKNDHLEVKIRKNSKDPVPFKLETYTKNGEKRTHWFDTPEKETVQNYIIPESDAEKIVINSGHYFPESSFRDNYIYTKGLFSNMKKIRFKLIKDIPNPEYNEIYLNPRLDFNAYDKVLVGLNFKNKSLFDQKFEYSLTPYFSTGTGQITGSGSVKYNFLPPESFFRELSLGVSGSYFHYDYDLSYNRISAFANINFTKNPRSAIGRSLGLSYNRYEKDLTPGMILNNDYDKYNLWNINYGYSDNRLIHEKFIGANLQGAEDFTKISAEAFYRYEFAKSKKISFRLFAGYFMNNDTRNDFFDYGISRVSNYSFSYGLIGQSATSGVLSQQFVLADGGFKSFINGSVNQWITSFNVDSHVWKMFNIYGDAGLYKNKHQNPKFIWDSGVKLRIVPDFLEIYLPVYSSLGFEPSFSDYAKRIRFTLVLNFGALVNTIRRGWY